VAVITEACLDVKDRVCVSVCPVQCIYEFDVDTDQLFSEDEPGAGIENTHTTAQGNPSADHTSPADPEIQTTEPSLKVRSFIMSRDITWWRGSISALITTLVLPT